MKSVENEDEAMLVTEEAERADDTHLVRLDNGKTVKDAHTNNIMELDEEQILATWLQEEVLAVMLPKEKRDTPECHAAKAAELQKLKDFDT